jgi:diguanylate cyclase (GGDEF)-like protein/PAS domain S-box-containing protein
MKKMVLALDDLLNLLPDAVVIVDARGIIVFANDAVQGLLGYSPAELVDKSLDCLIPKSYRSEHRVHFERFREHGNPMAMGDRPLVDGLDKFGNEVPVSIAIANIDLDDEQYSIAVMRDVGELQSEITEITFQAETDVLTGLGNRLQLSHALETAIEKTGSFSLLFMDLEKFKPINDSYGHEVGDKVLQIVAKRLQTLIRPQDMAARIGGDEFVLFLNGLVDIRTLEQRATAVADSIKRPFHIGGLSEVVGVNIGCAQYPRDGKNESELLRVADQNMYWAKQRGLAYKISD